MTIKADAMAYGYKHATATLNQIRLEEAFLAGARRAAVVCREYAHSGRTGVLRRQVCYALERRILEDAPEFIPVPSVADEVTNEED